MASYSGINDPKVGQTNENNYVLEAARDDSGRSEGHDWSRCLVVLDSRTLGRECLVRGLATNRIRMEVTAFASMEEWKSEEELHPPLSAILFNVGGRKFTDQNLVNEATRLVSEYRSVPIVVLTDTEDIMQVLKALECGARGYIPASVGLDVCVEAINLAIAGGIFVPASSLFAMREFLGSSLREPTPISTIFTARQAAVADALRRGKANKIIAYELNMCESTVKVHVRHIMKKLKATNRTEIAYKISGLWAPDAQITGQKGPWQKSGGKRPPESWGKEARTPRSLVPSSRAAAGKTVTKTTDPKSDNGDVQSIEVEEPTPGGATAYYHDYQHGRRTETTKSFDRRVGTDEHLWGI